MTTMRMLLMNKRVSQAIDALTLIVVVLLVPYTHGYLQYFGLIVAGLLVVVVKTAILRRLAKP